MPAEASCTNLEKRRTLNKKVESFQLKAQQMNDLIEFSITANC